MEGATSGISMKSVTQDRAILSFELSSQLHLPKITWVHDAISVLEARGEGELDTQHKICCPAVHALDPSTDETIYPNGGKWRQYSAHCQSLSLSGLQAILKVSLKLKTLPSHSTQGGKKKKKYKAKEIWNQKIKGNLGNFISVSIWMFSFSCFYLLVFSFLDF